MNNDKDTKYQNLWNGAKTVLKWKFLSINANIFLKQRSQINKLNFHLKEQGKEQQIKSRTSKKKKMIKIRVEIKEMENGGKKEMKSNSIL